MTNTVSFPNFNLTFRLNRVAFSIFGVDIYWYALIITFGIILAYIYVTHEAKRQKLNADCITDMVLIALPAAIIGARLYYVAATWDYYSRNLSEIINLRQGGLAVYGGAIFGAAAAFIYLKVKKQNILKYYDILVIGLLIGQCVGRWGNFVNVEAYGCETESLFKMQIYSDIYNKTVNVHPTFLYESFWNFIGLIWMSLYIRHKRFDGEIFLSYLWWYGLGRFFIEGLRTDSLYAGPFRISQVVALVSFLAGAGGIIFHYVKNKKA